MWSQDQPLIDAWEGDVVVEGVGDLGEYGLEIGFEADGRLVYIQKITLGPPESGSDPGGSSGPVASSDSDSLVIVLEGTGTWRNEGQVLTLDLADDDGMRCEFGLQRERERETPVREISWGRIKERRSP